MDVHRRSWKGAKCVIAHSKIQYLGHQISSKGVEADEEKIKSMINCPQPKDVTGLRGFLGLTGYYRRFVKGYGEIAAPLTKLLQKNAFHWNEEATIAFELLKTSMTTTPVLTLPDWSLPFVLETDASVQKWRHYLLRQKFTIISDKKALKFLLKQREVQPQFQKWLTKLLGYDFEILYQPGLQNKAADALFKLKQTAELNAMTTLGIIDIEVVEKDGELQEIIKKLEGESG
ncbi:Retrotransposable element Tf2 [Cucumis melo var. makuwa]|uniref:Retrotransposable element Tf2 n=1 Tax=Cucumis melo var. makuwa TaxID=1194695 RepID=A0A5A7UQF1_CUCMM|nr:Retrotransposable element Tf2 [Cucumis melo var. makuwa]TYK09368.1 Retrotransposable element Tf2 [Cucumis melo var. makuwa]